MLEERTHDCWARIINKCFVENKEFKGKVCKHNKKEEEILAKFTNPSFKFS